LPAIDMPLFPPSIYMAIGFAIGCLVIGLTVAAIWYSSTSAEDVVLSRSLDADKGNEKRVPIGNMLGKLPRAYGPSYEVAIYRHRAGGGRYVVLDYAAKLECSTFPEIEEKLAPRLFTIYRSLDDGSCWIRLTSEFKDGRFERVI